MAPHQGVPVGSTLDELVDAMERLKQAAGVG